MTMQTRTRFAPSPTGYLHIGGLRTALYNWLIAKKNNGSFVLRIEDTDRSRFVPGAIENLIKIFKIFGLEPDEGPVLNEKEEIVEKGDNGPYIQSKKLDVYREAAKQLVKNGHAYYCFCSSEELELNKAEQIKNGEAPRYNRRCRDLDNREAQKRIEAGELYVIRLKVPLQGKIKFNDLIRGEVEFDYSLLDDQVLLKSDGWPTYHLAVVVDDHHMKITHVLRAEEWLPSTPKHIYLYRAFGWELPQFGHLPLLLNPDRSKLSKRHADVAVEDYLKKGYLIETIINFIALLGWNPGTDQEIFSLQELIREFSIEKIQKAGAVLDVKKLDWLNSCYIKKKNLDELTSLILPFLKESNLTDNITDEKLLLKIKKIVALSQDRLKRLNEIGEIASMFFNPKLDYSSDLLVWKNETKDSVIKNLENIKKLIKTINNRDFDKQHLNEKIVDLTAEAGNGPILWPLRVALSGEKNSPPPLEIADILGKDETLLRINKAVGKLK
ncbi:MAG: glutamate--tRNA ligase [Patescibacteria group bacterium]